MSHFSLRDRFDENGRPKAPFRTGNGTDYSDLQYVRSLEGVILGVGSTLEGLEQLETLRGITFSPGSQLCGLNAIKSIRDVTLAKSCELWGLRNCKTITQLRLKAECELHGLQYLTTLRGIQLANDCELHDLYSVKSINGIVLPVGCKLYDMRALKAIHNVTMRAESLIAEVGNVRRITKLNAHPEATISGLFEPVHIGIPQLRKNELKWLLRIPTDKLDMTTWHQTCGTVHCLAGWAEVFKKNGGSMSNFSRDADDIGTQTFPSLAWIFYNTDLTMSVSDLLTRIQKRYAHLAPPIDTAPPACKVFPSGLR